MAMDLLLENSGSLYVRYAFAMNVSAQLHIWASMKSSHTTQLFLTMKHPHSRRKNCGVPPDQYHIVNKSLQSSKNDSIEGLLYDVVSRSSEDYCFFDG
jgi:hypothetical protein